MDPRKFGRIVLLVLILTFALFAFFWEQKVDELKKDQIREQAKVIENAIWNLDPLGPVEYLKIAARLSKYETVKVYTLDNEELFISVDGPVPGPFKKMLIRLRLIPRIDMATDILHNGSKIGSLHVVYLHDTIYVYLYLLVILGLAWVAIKYFAYTIYAKQTLEIKVDERTRELKQLQNLLSNIINSMPSVLVGVDEDIRVTQWNHEAQNLTRITFQEAKGRLLSEVFTGLENEIPRISRAIQTRNIKRQAKQKFKTGDRTFFWDITIYPLVADSVRGAVIRIDDVTDRVRMEEMMIQTEKVMSLGGLAAGMAHEINNPLAGMLQSAQVIQERLTREIPVNVDTARECGTELEKIQRFMEKRNIIELLSAIRTAGTRAARIVENMLSFGRAGESRFEPVNLSELCEDTILLAENDYDLKKNYDFRRIQVTKAFQTDMPLVPCERGKIQQVILNLLKNAAQAMNPLSGKPSVDSKAPMVIVIRTRLENTMAVIEVEDNGPGMDETVSKKIFEPFFTTKNVGEGTGLGLSVAYFIVTENHCGIMEVESQKGQGTRFIIRLPLNQTIPITEQRV